MKCARCGFSRGAATECSPGRKPGVNSNPGSQPQRGERFEWIRGILRPYGAGTSTLFHPRACARGCILTPLRGWNAQIVIHSHLLAPGATLCRRFAAKNATRTKFPLEGMNLSWSLEEKMKRMLFYLVVGIIMFGPAGGNAWAQATAQIAGTVKDQTGAVLPGVEIT